MNLFSWLVVAHLVGDWLLQNAWMAQEKFYKPHGRAILIHCTIYTSVIMLPLCAYSRGDPWQTEWLQSVWLGVIVFVSHWLIDGAQLAHWWGRVYQQSELAFVRMMADQTLHLLVLAIIAGWLIDVPPSR